MNLVEKSTRKSSFQILIEFINLHFSEKFSFIKNCKYNVNGHIVIDDQYYIYECINNFRYKYDINDYFMFINEYGKYKSEIKEIILRKQEDNSSKKYELICIIAYYGETTCGKTSISGTDVVLILPVFDKNKKIRICILPI